MFVVMNIDKLWPWIVVNFGHESILMCLRSWIYRWTLAMNQCVSGTEYRWTLAMNQCVCGTEYRWTLAMNQCICEEMNIGELWPWINVFVVLNIRGELWPWINVFVVLNIGELWPWISMFVVLHIGELWPWICVCGHDYRTFRGTLSMNIKLSSWFLI